MLLGSVLIRLNEFLGSTDQHPLTMRECSSLLNRMRLVIGVALITAPVLLRAQVALYEFSDNAGTYQEISASDGGVSLGVPVYWPHVNNNRGWVNNPFNDPDGQVTLSGYLNPASGPGYPIGFDFSFNGDVFDVIGISNGGWISFGKSADALQAVWVYNWSGTPNGDPFTQWYNGPSPSYKRNRVAGFGNSSLQMVDWSSLAPPGQVSNLRVATIGTAPNRVCVVQFKDFGLRNDVTVAMNRINFQIRLNESDNSVEVVFGPMDWVSSLGRYQPTQIGLSGRTNADFNGRMTVAEEPDFLYDWNNTVPADSNIASEASCVFVAPQPNQPAGSGIVPEEGLTWRWVAPVCPPPTWPLVVGNITFSSAIATWEPFVPGEYEYIVTDVNDVNAPVIVSGTTTDPEIIMEGLQPLTEYYIFVRAICGGELGTWSWATNFRTLAGGVVVCDGTAEEGTYCSYANDTIQWHFVSEMGSALKIEFIAGYIGNTGGGSLRIWDGPAAVGQPAFSAPQGDVTGQYFTANMANGGQMFMQLIADAGNCHDQSWYLPLEWRIGCKDCADPLANFSVVDDCDNEQYSVVVNLGTMGGVSALRIENTLGVAPTVVSAIGQHTVGPFPSGQSTVITVVNPDNDLCYVASPPMIGSPCAIVGCGPTTVTYCYGNNENRNWAYQGEGGQEIGLRFMRGGLGMGDDLMYYNGLNPDAIPVDVGSWLAGITNTLITSGAPSTDHAIVLELASDNMHSCADVDPFYGSTTEWEFVVACYDGCTQPQASFTTVCVDQTHFNVEVNVTVLGSSGSVVISNDGGVASFTANTVGSHTVGPFISGTPVTIEVEGASVLCSWTGADLNRSCLDIGMEEAAMNTLALFPNPNDGRFTLELPEGQKGTSELRVLDLAGRVVAQQACNGAAKQELHFTNLPSGLYTLVLQNNGRAINGKVSIQH